MLSAVRRAIRSITSSFWFWPLVFIAGGMQLAVLVASLGTAPEVARSLPRSYEVAAAVYAAPMLTTMAAAAVTIVTFVFSTLMIVLQLASSQLSPRILRRTVREGRAQVVMAILVGTFAYAMYSLSLIYGEPSPAVPALLVSVGILLSIVNLFALLYFTGFVVDRVRAPAVIRRIAEATGASIDRLYRHAGAAPTRVQDALSFEVVDEVRSRKEGSVTGIDTADLLRWARRHDAVVELLVGLGDPITRGVPIARVHAARTFRRAGFAVAGALTVEPERTVGGDPPFGFRLLVDIANRALSSAVNDPTTAVQVLDALQGLLGRLASHPERPGYLYDRTGTLRVIVPEMSFRAYLNMSVQEIYIYGGNSPQVTQRIRHMLDDLEQMTSGVRRNAVMSIRSKIRVVDPMIPLSEHERAGSEA